MAEIYTVGENFKRQLQGLFRDSLLPAENPAILERITKGSAYFLEKLEAHLWLPLQQLHIDTDNNEIRKRADDALKRVKEEGAIKMAAVTCCRSGFSPVGYLRSISSAEIEYRKKPTKSSPIIYSEADIAHPELFKTLREWRTKKANDENSAPFQVMHQKTLIQITIHLPDSPAALKKIKGIGKQLSKRYGDELISMVTAYRQEHGIEQVILPAVSQQQTDTVSESKKNKADTKNTREMTLELFKKGLTTEEIAKERSLVNSTIEGHLAFFVAAGRVKIETVLPEDKIKLIEQTINRTSSFGEVKHALGSNCSYSEIKLVQAHMNYSRKK